MTTLDLTFSVAQSKSYPIIIEKGLLSDIERLQQYIPQQDICIVTNQTVAPLYLYTLKQGLVGKNIIEIILPDGEEYKNLAQCSYILDKLIEHRFGRDAVLIALGGGVIGDLTGFAAASYQRGIAFVQIPTTLLSQVDSSVGGKTGVNHPQGKNMIGAFHQPQVVFIDPNTLDTLSVREFSAGLAEVIKYGLINDMAFFHWLEKNMDGIMAQDAEILIQTIAHCCQNKANIVKIDECEHGQRALLNLGHTFGHALEALSHYKIWKHGEAVAIGMRMVGELAYLRNEITAVDLTRMIALLKKAKLPVNIGNTFTVEMVYDAMFLDKKVRKGRLRLIAFNQLGNCRVADDITEAEICQAIRNAL